MLLSPVADQPSPPATRKQPQALELGPSAAAGARAEQPRPFELEPAALDFSAWDAAGRVWTIVFEQIRSSEALAMSERGGSIPFVCREWRRLAELHFSIFPFPLGPAAALTTMLATVSSLEPDLTAPESNPRSGDKAVWFYTGKITHTRGPRTVARAVWRSTQAKSLIGATVVHCPHGLSLAVSAGRRRGVVAVLFGRNCIWGVTAYPRPSVKWDGDILSFLFACSRFASSLQETWCDRFDASSIFATVTKAGGQMHSTQARNAVAELVERFATVAAHLARPSLQRLRVQEESLEEAAARGDATASLAIDTELRGLASEQVFLAGDKQFGRDGPIVSLSTAAEFVVDWRLIGKRHVRKLQADYAEASRGSTGGFSPPGSPSRRQRAHAYQSSRHSCSGSSPHLSVSGWSLHINMHGRDQPSSGCRGELEVNLDGAWQCISTWYQNFERALFNSMIRDGKLLQGALWYFVTVFEEMFDSNALAGGSEAGDGAKTTGSAGRSGLEWMGQAALARGATLRSMVAATAVRLTQARAVDMLLRSDEDLCLWWQYAVDRMVAVLRASAASQQDNPSRSRAGAGGSSPRAGLLTGSVESGSTAAVGEEEQQLQLLADARRSIAPPA